MEDYSVHSKYYMVQQGFSSSQYTLLTGLYMFTRARREKDKEYEEYRRKKWGDSREWGRVAAGHFQLFPCFLSELYTADCLINNCFIHIILGHVCLKVLYGIWPIYFLFK